MRDYIFLSGEAFSIDNTENVIIDILFVYYTFYYSVI